MAKLTLTSIADISGNPLGAATAINANNDLIEAALENTFSRDGTAPNTLSEDLDMNSNRLLNVPDAILSHEPMTLGQYTAIGGTDWSAAIAAKANISHTHTTSQITDYTTNTNSLINAAIGSIAATGVSDGDKGDITVTSSGTAWAVDSGAITYAKMQNISVTDRLLGRSSAGAGVVQEIACTAAGRAILDDTDAAAQRTTLGLGTAATSASSAFATSSHNHVGTEITSGLIPDARLNTTIPRYADSTANFTGTLQCNGVDVGYKTIPQNSQSGNYTCVLTDGGKHIYHPTGSGTGHTYTIPANSSVAYPIGTAITFVNMDTAYTVAIAITTDTMYLSGSGTIGTRTLGTYGEATALKIGTTSWLISGTDLT